MKPSASIPKLIEDVPNLTFQTPKMLDSYIIHLEALLKGEVPTTKEWLDTMKLLSNTVYGNSEA